VEVRTGILGPFQDVRRVENRENHYQRLEGMLHAVKDQKGQWGEVDYSNLHKENPLILHAVGKEKTP
jgi:hypothetical protein